jgi:protein-disulfide isomerase
MPKLSRRLLLAAAAGALALAGCSKGAGGGADAADMTLGDPNAPVKIVEYASVTCSHCATFNNEVFPQLKAKYIDTGKVHYTFKEFLTPPAPVAAAGFLTARCAGEDKYFSVIDAIFHAQQEMFTTGDMRGVLLRVAQSAGMTEDEFTKCVSDEAALKALQARVEKAVNEDKVTATPTFFLNGEKFKEGEATLAEFDAAIAKAGAK